MIQLGRAFGIPIRLQATWFVVVAIVTSSLAVAYFPRVLPQTSALAHWSWAVGAAALLFASLVIHELAHALVARRFGMRVRSITLHALGGVSEMIDEPAHPRAEFVIAIAGPVMSFALAGFAGVVRMAGGGSPAVDAMVDYLGTANLVIAVFNLAPAFPLDGGRMLRAALWAWRGQLPWATRVAAIVGRACGLALAAVGVTSALGRGSIVTGLWLIMLGIFIHEAARAGGAIVEVREYELGEGRSSPLQTSSTREV